MTMLPLTAAQHGIWVGHRLAPDPAIYNTAECVEFVGPVDPAVLLASIEDTLREAETLHLRVCGPPDDVHQIVDRATPLTVQAIDLSDAPDPPSSMRARLETELAIPFDLERAPPVRVLWFRLGPQRWSWCTLAHHIALDGFGYAWLRTRVLARVRARLTGRRPPAPPAAPSFADVVREDAAYRASIDRRRDRAFWAHEMAGSLGGRGGASSVSGATTPTCCATHLPASFSARLRTRATSVDLAWPHLLLAGLVAALAEETGEVDPVFGLPTMAAMGSIASRVPGMHMNILPLRLRGVDAPSLVALAGRVARTLERIRPHARYRYEWLRRDLGRVGGGKRLWGPVVNLMPWGGDVDLGALRMTWHPVRAGPVEDLSIAVRGDSAHGLTLQLEAPADLHPPDRLRATLARLVDAMQGTLAEPHARRRPVPPPPEGRALDVLERIASVARLRPDAAAIASEDGEVGFAQLHERARRYAAHLHSHGVGPHDRVIVALPRSVDAIAAVLAVWILGATYVPIDPLGPEQRTASVVRRAAPRLILAPDADWEARWADTIRTVTIERMHDPRGAVASTPLGDVGPAYVIFTSGSTGRPHGVVVERPALAHFVSAARERYGWTEADRVLQFAPLQFDASIEEIFVALSAGATVVLRDEDMLTSFATFESSCARSDVTILDLPTAYWHAWVQAIADGASRVPPRVRQVILGGEAVLPGRLAQWQSRVSPDVALLNTYGPTETTVVVSSAAIEREPPSDRVTIGSALPGVDLAVVDPEGSVCPAGVVGELHVAGPTLAREYLGEPQATRERFFVDAEGTRWFRTGDLVLRRIDGGLEFVGRVDDRVKINGQRIDPQEVEVALSACPRVREAAVLARTDGEGSTSLVAAIVDVPPALTDEALRRALRAQVLPVAIPGRFLRLAALPKTDTGKLDRAALRELVRREMPSDVPRPAATDLRGRVLQIWQDVLGRPDLEPHDDVFEAGGHSLQTLSVAHRLSAWLGRTIPTTWVFQYPNAADLARALADEDPRDDHDATRARMRLDATLDPDWAPTPAGPTPAPPRPRRVLLTGATGFVGAHVLHELIDRTDATVHCLVRCPDPAEGLERLTTAMVRHGLPLPPAGRVHVTPTDLGREGFGWDRPTFERHSGSGDAIVHVAADVHLMRPYAGLRAVNVEATRQLVRLAMTGSPKVVTAVSSVAVAPLHGVPEDFVPDHPGLIDGYAQTKWVSERLLAEAGGRGLRVRVVRLGRVVGTAASGWINPADIIWRLLRLGLRIGALPDLDLTEPWIPADDAARGIVASTDLAEPGALVVNLSPSEPVALARIYADLRAFGHRFEVCDLPSWLDRARDQADEASRTTLAFFAGRTATPTGPIVIASRRLAELRPLAELAWTPIDRSLVHRYLTYGTRTGALPPPSPS